MSLLPPFRPCSPKPNEITATGGAHWRKRARCGPDRSEPGPANSPPDYAVRGRLKCVARSDFALKARPERRHLCPHPTIATASTVAPRLFANGEVSRNVPLLRSRQLRPRKLRLADEAPPGSANVWRARPAKDNVKGHK